MEDIRPMRIEDIPECVSVIRSAFKTVADDLGFTPENAPRFTAFATNEKRLYYQFTEEHRPMYVFEKDGRMIGYYSLAILNDDEIELNNLSEIGRASCREKQVPRRSRSASWKRTRYCADGTRIKASYTQVR